MRLGDADVGDGLQGRFLIIEVHDAGQGKVRVEEEHATRFGVDDDRGIAVGVGQGRGIQPHGIEGRLGKLAAKRQNDHDNRHQAGDAYR